MHNPPQTHPSPAPEVAEPAPRAGGQLLPGGGGCAVPRGVGRLALRPQPGVRSGAEQRGTARSPPARLAALWEAGPKNRGAVPSGGRSSGGGPLGCEAAGGSPGRGEVVLGSSGQLLVWMCINP